ncbi:MAG TPA: quinone-dependent dihydroorotate dehydrogenase [Stellaceae bacterium]|nr:quinone-dependent dihydroorotate dehydrogenase [Stellaceae bacterium]
MPNLYPLARPIFGLLQPETARDLTIRCLEVRLGELMVEKSARQPDPRLLSQCVWNLTFTNPIGLAAGFDKDARVPDDILKSWRFGFVEVGTVTPRPQYGNPKPRVFRLREDDAIINRMGFNSCGLSEVCNRLRARQGRQGIIGLNLGKNRETEDDASDYEEGIRRAAGLVSYFVVNVSSPNTPGLRDLQRRAPLEQLLQRVVAARDATSAATPLLVKIAPDLSLSECKDVATVARKSGIDGIIISNTTTDHSGLKSSARTEDGGLSGRPLFERSTKLLAQMYTLTEGQLPLIGVGGVTSAADAYEKICAGASLVQVYTALAFNGPMLVSRIKWGLAEILAAKGFSSVQAAVGSRSATWAATSEHGSTRLRGVPDTGQTDIMSATRRHRILPTPWPLSST